MSESQSITYEDVRSAVESHGVAFRSTVRLEPAGGTGDKIFPPTYIQEGREPTKYAFETRRVDGQEVRVVLLDSVQSQANRLEEALLSAVRTEQLRLPMVEVDFSDIEGLEDLDRITSLQAPHRVADALLRDSVLDGVPFRYSPVGQAVTDARPNHATAMYRYCPTALIFGVWDSTGPKGGLGAKFQRALVSEIVGFNAVAGAKTASRIDPTGIETKAGPVYQHKDAKEGWTDTDKDAAKDKGKPVLVGGKDAKAKGNPSAVNHGNIPPSIDHVAGGVTIDYATQTTVLSLPALRRLGFVTNVDGKPFGDPAARAKSETAARTLLASVALAAVSLQRAEGYDLRSRSLLVVSDSDPWRFEMLSRDGGKRDFSLPPEQALKLAKEAHQNAQEAGLGWTDKPVVLKPAAKLVGLIRRSRELSAVEAAEEQP